MAYSGIAPGGSWGPTWDAGEAAQVGHRQGQLDSHWTLTLAPRWGFLETKTEFAACFLHHIIYKGF